MMLEQICAGFRNEGVALTARDITATEPESSRIPRCETRQLGSMQTCIFLTPDFIQRRQKACAKNQFEISSQTDG